MTNEMQLRRQRAYFIELAERIGQLALDDIRPLKAEELAEIDKLLGRAKALDPEISRLEAEARADVAAELASRQRF